MGLRCLGCRVGLPAVLRVPDASQGARQGHVERGGAEGHRMGPIAASSASEEEGLGTPVPPLGGLTEAEEPGVVVGAGVQRGRSLPGYPDRYEGAPCTEKVRAVPRTT